MGKDLEKLEALAKGLKMTERQQEQQRRSFAYGNAGIENRRITREMVDEQAEKLNAQNG